MANISKITIDGVTFGTNSRNAKTVVIDVGIHTTSTTAGDKLSFEVETKRTQGGRFNGNGTLYQTVEFDSDFDDDSSGPLEYIYTLHISCDHLFAGGNDAVFSFRVTVNGHASDWYDGVYMSRSFNLEPLDGYMIPERPSQQVQYVYYDGVHMGEAGCCVSSALAAAKEVQEIRSGRGTLQHSVGWFFGATADGDGGTTYVTALNFLRDSGMMLYPHTRSSYVTSYPDVYFYSDKSGYKGGRSLYLEHQNLKKSLPQKISSWKKLSGNWNEPFGWQNIIDAIQRTSGSSSSAVLVSVGIDDAFRSVGSDGIMEENHGAFQDGHMMLVLGWKMINRQPYFICQNSWGAGWGDNGLVYIPFYNIRHVVDGFWTGIQDFYEIVDDPNAPELNVFSWTYAGLDTSGNPVSGGEKKAGYGVYVTAKEWNQLAGLVKTATGKSVTTVSPGTPISAAVVNTMARALGVKTVSKGDAITASFFNALVEAYNALS